MKQQEIADLSAELIIKYYENDYMPFLESFDDDSLWYGPAEGQFLRGREAMIRAWQAEEHSLRFTMGNLKVVHISGNSATCSVMLTYTVVTHYPDGHDDNYTTIPNSYLLLKTLIDSYLLASFRSKSDFPAFLHAAERLCASDMPN